MNSSYPCGSPPPGGRKSNAPLRRAINPSRLVPTNTDAFIVSSLLAARAALAQFITAFDNLDWEAFRSAFDDDATVFYPRGVPERANGRAEFERTFRIVFEQIRQGKTAAPFMDIQPRDLKLQIFGEIAI